MNKYHDKDLSAYNFLVTGGAGFIGSHLVEYLLHFGAKKVRVLDNLSNGFQTNVDLFSAHENYEFIEGDICDLDTCRTAVNDIDFVFHEAALGSVPRSIETPLITHDSNINGFLNMLEAIKEAEKKPKLVYAASSSTYGDSKTLPKVEANIGSPLSPYAVTKYVNELYADVYSKTYDMRIVGLRYFNVFGPRQNPDGAYAAVIPKFIKAAFNNESPIIHGDGEQTRDFTFVDNVVQANIKAALTELDTKHEVFNVACGERTSLNQIWNSIKEITKTKINAQYGPTRQGDIRDSLASIEKIESSLNYKPNFLLHDGLKLTVPSYSA